MRRRGRYGLFLHPIRAFLYDGVGAPGHDRHSGRGILRRTLDDAIAIDHIDQYVALGVAAPHDLHLFEEQRAALAKHILALHEFFLDLDRPNLAAGERNIGDLLRDPYPAFKATALRHGEMARHALDLGVVDTVSGELVV